MKQLLIIPFIFTAIPLFGNGKTPKHNSNAPSKPAKSSGRSMLQGLWNRAFGSSPATNENQNGAAAAPADVRIDIHPAADQKAAHAAAQATPQRTPAASATPAPVAVAPTPATPAPVKPSDNGRDQKQIAALQQQETQKRANAQMLETIYHSLATPANERGKKEIMYAWQDIQQKVQIRVGTRWATEQPQQEPTPTDYLVVAVHSQHFLIAQALLKHGVRCDNLFSTALSQAEYNAWVFLWEQGIRPTEVDWSNLIHRTKKFGDFNDFRFVQKFGSKDQAQDLHNYYRELSLAQLNNPRG